MNKKIVVLFYIKFTPNLLDNKIIYSILFILY